MKVKSKLIILLGLLAFLIFISNLLFNIKSKSYKLKYNSNEFSIKETYKKNIYLEIKSKKNKYSLEIFKKLDNTKKIVNEIYYYNDKEYECLLPIIDNKVIVDMMCYKGKVMYDYHTIMGDNDKLDKYVENIKIYDVNKFKDNLNDKKSIDTINIYKNNEIDNIVALTTYKGIIVSGEHINLFKEDIYNNKLSTFVDNYYIIVDYENDYEFKYFYVVNLLNKEVSKIKSKEEISLDSYIQGVVENIVYLYDKNNEKQYAINIEKKEVELISKNDSVKYYKNGIWETINKNKANKEIYFDYSTLDNDYTDYDYVIKTEYYYYLFKKSDNMYDLYRIDKNDLKFCKYIIKIPTTKISFKDNYIYYVYNNNLYYYSDNTGLKTILDNSEFKFNKTIKYYIY